MREKIFPAVFLMLVLLIGFPSSVGNFSAFADDDDDNDNLKVSAKESRAYEKQKEKAEKAKEKAEERKYKLKEKYDREIQRLEEKTKKLEEKEKAKYERELKKLEEKAQRLEEDYDHDDDIEEFGESVNIDYSSKTTAICHIPPGNPDNYRTLTVGTPAVRAHEAHGDSVGECGDDGGLILEERELKLAAKLAELEEKRAELEQKLSERAEKLSEKLAKLNAKSQKLLEKFHSGEYFGELYDEDKQIRELVLNFDGITGESLMVDSLSSFDVDISLTTYSSSSSGHQKFRVDSCQITGDDASYHCEFGKARSVSSGTGKNNALDIVAVIQDDNSDDTLSLRAHVSPIDSSRTWLLEDTTEVTLNAKISLQWALSGDGTLTVTASYLVEQSEVNEAQIEDDVDDVEDEIEFEGTITAIDDESFELLLEDCTTVTILTGDTSGLAIGDEVEVEVEEDIDGNLVAIEIGLEEYEDEEDDEDEDDDEDNED